MKVTAYLHEVQHFEITEVVDVSEEEYREYLKSGKIPERLKDNLSHKIHPLGMEVWEQRLSSVEKNSKYTIGGL